MTADLKTGTSLLPGSQASGTVDSGVTLTISGAPTGGTFTVSVTAGGTTATTSGVAFNAAAATTLQTALQGLSNVGAGNLLASGSAGGPFTITAPAAFTCTLATSGASLTGGTTPATAIAEIPKAILTVSGASAAAAALVVKTARLANRNTTSAATVTVWATPSGQTRDSTRIIVPPYSLAAGDTTRLDELEGGMLEGQFVVTAGTGNAINAVNYLVTGAVSS